MKNQLLNLGKALSKTEQKEIFGGNRGLKNPCPCTYSYSTGMDNSCTYPGNDPNFPGGVCLGTVQNGMCCVN